MILWTTPSRSKPTFFPMLTKFASTCFFSLLFLLLAMRLILCVFFFVVYSCISKRIGFRELFIFLIPASSPRVGNGGQFGDNGIGTGIISFDQIGFWERGPAILDRIIFDHFFLTNTAC